MSRFKFLHAADVHLDSPLRGLARYEGAPVEEIRGAARRAFENLVDLALAEEAAFVLLAGDLYDGDWKDANTGLFFVSQAARLGAAGIPVFAVAGNHDAASQISRTLRLPAGVRMLSARRPETVQLADLGVAVHGQGFATAAVRDDLAAGYPPALPGLFNVGLLHTSLDGRPGHDSYAPCVLDTLRARGYAYWALGHVHEREVVCRDPWVVFPGNLQGRHAREHGPKGATLVTVEDGEVAAVEHRDLDVLRWAVVEVDGTGAGGAGEALERAREALAGELMRSDGQLLAARLVFTGTCVAHEELAADLEHCRDEVRALGAGLGGAVWIEKVVVRTRRERAFSAPGSGPGADDLAGALGGLLRTVSELAAEPARLAPLVAPDGPLADLTELRRRLPAELFAAEAGGLAGAPGAAEAFDPADPMALAALLDGVGELLLSRLLDARDREGEAGDRP